MAKKTQDGDEGRRKKQEGQARAEYGAGPEWCQEFNRALESVRSFQRLFVVDNVLNKMDPKIKPSNDNKLAAGSLMSHAVRDKLVVRHGYRESERDNRHRGTITLWRSMADHVQIENYTCRICGDFLRIDYAAAQGRKAEVGLGLDFSDGRSGFASMKDCEIQVCITCCNKLKNAPYPKPGT